MEVQSGSQRRDALNIPEVQYGLRTRRSFSHIDEKLNMPDLIEVQKNSYKSFIESGMKEVLREVSPVESVSKNLMMEFLDYTFDIDGRKHKTVEECKSSYGTYSAPLRVSVRLTEFDPNTHEVLEVKDNASVYLGDFPIMTPQGTFIINGAERVIVSQLVRSPGAYFSESIDSAGKRLYSAQVIPNKGTWLEYETDSNLVIHVKLNHQKRKLPAVVLIRAIGVGTDEEIYEMFGDDERLRKSIQKDISKFPTELGGLLTLHEKLKPDDPATEEGARAHLDSLYFSDRYDLARVGRYKFNKKLGLSLRIKGLIAAEDVIDTMTGEILVSEGEPISEELSIKIENSGIQGMYVYASGGNRVRVVGNRFVDAAAYLSFDPELAGLNEKVYYPLFAELLETIHLNNMTEKEQIELLSARKYDLIPRRILREDIIASISYLIGLPYGIGKIDDIDHLGNRRIRSVGELLQNQMVQGFSKLERNIKERMSSLETDKMTPALLINTRHVTAAIKEFFSSSQLSQFMDQINPLAELTNKRRLSALGAGGLSRERASFDVRDVHYSHFGRICPIETPEGQNIGLINSLSTYARINEYGFIEAPYRIVDPKSKVITDEVVYLSADEEDGLIIAQANEPTITREDGTVWFEKERLIARLRDQIIETEPDKIKYMDVSPKQLISVATAMIPFLENDDANRALMGSNMQRQAVPLLVPEAPVVATGMEYRAAKDSGVVIVAECDGIVTYVSADKIVVTDDFGARYEYNLIKFSRSNQATCVNQRPLVTNGQKVHKGDIIADGASTSGGEISLGKNILVGFMTWEGYNYEDAVLISEELVRDDVYTSIHIEKYEIEARETKLGPEEITRDLPSQSDSAKHDLDEDGIVRVGAEVHAGDILVGKVTPKGETELTSEEKLLRAIFGEKARERRDTSLRVPHGEDGIVVDVKIISRDDPEAKHELTAGVDKLVRVYIAQKRKISVGDKMAGRHGNKGVVSRILPVEDMPFLPDGTPLQIVLNPLGVPSRMNIGQVLELHLGRAARALGWHIATPVFDGATQDDIEQLLVAAGFDGDGKTVLYDGRSGEPFESRISVGYMYYLKLLHLVEDKIHARSTGPYALITQQPLGGKAQFGGQRFGEMEVWALEAYGAANTLQEILTIKSDDIDGRSNAYKAIIDGKNIPTPGVPESFKVLIMELKSLGFDVKLVDDGGRDIPLETLTYPDDSRNSGRGDYDNEQIAEAMYGESVGVDLDESAYENEGFTIEQLDKVSHSNDDDE